MASVERETNIRYVVVYQPPQKTNKPEDPEAVGIGKYRELDCMKHNDITLNPEHRKGSFFAIPLGDNGFRL